MSRVASAESIVVRTHGAVSEAETEYARRRVGAALRHAPEPVLFVRVKLSRLSDPAVPRPAVAQVNVDLDGRLVRAQAARPTLREAVDEVHDRLRDRVRRADRGWEAARGARPSDRAHEWRHQTEPAERLRYFPRPVEERQIVRRKAFGLGRMTVDEAIEEMVLLDYRFHLFTEAGSGVDSLVHRTDEPVGTHLVQAWTPPVAVSPASSAVTVDPQRAPRLTLPEAVERLDAMGPAFVFFTSTTTGRGCVLYRRYDGHYGLITPAE